ncbi:MAG: nucleotidyltransferase domain-containing protein [Phycisphaerae bacterium]|nr:nucleotidyltransferase domain-containing protein [Phycisphaerae bacterium]
MLSIEQIKTVTQKVAPHYPVRRVLLFGSYASGQASDQSDVDMLVEFSISPVSLFELAGFNQELRQALHVAVDTVKLPLKENIIDITKAVPLYECSK